MKSCALFLAMLAGSGLAAAAPVLSVGSTVGAPGSTVPVAVNYTTDTNAPSLQFDLLYATNYLATGPPTGGNALSDHLIGSSEPFPGVRRVLILSLANTPITNGVLVYVPFMLATNSPDHDEPLTLSNVLVSSPDAFDVPAYSSNGVLSITVPSQFASLVSSNGAVHLQLMGATGRAYRLETETNLVPPQWMALATNVATNGIATFDDPGAAAAPARFYRASLAR